MTLKTTLLGTLALVTIMAAPVVAADTAAKKITLSNGYAGNSWRQSMLQSWAKIGNKAVADAFTSVALHRMVYGRSVMAIGQNMRAARLAGINVGRIRFLTYLLSGALGGIDGALLAAYFRGSAVDIGAEYLLASIAVVVIGGTSVAGGRANVPGIWGAALFLVLLQIMLNTFGADASIRLVVTGFVIIAVITAAGAQKSVRG